MIMALSAAAGISDSPNCPADGILQAKIPDWKGLSTMVAVHDHLIACRGTIEHLDLRVYLAGCSEWPDRWNFPFPFTGGNGGREEQQQGDTSFSYYYPTLKSLKLDGYKFDQSDWADLQPKDWNYLWWIQSGRFRRWWALWWSTPRERLKLRNLDLWLEAMDWGALERLEFALAVGAGRDGPRHAAVRLFTAALPRDVRLESLVWTDPSWDPAALGPILDRHGPSLRRLEIWSHEPWYSGYFDPAKAALNVSQIQRIAEGMGYFRGGRVGPTASLGRRLARPRVRLYTWWPNDRSLALAGMQGRRKYRRPVLDLTSVSDIFRFMREKKVGPAELERVTFWVGDWERPWDGPIYEQSWVEGRKARVDCNVLRQDDDGPRTGILEGMCEFTLNQTGGWVFFDEEFGLDGDGLPYRLPYTIATLAVEEQEVLNLQGEMAL
ncbi:hypothetical protein PG997_013312 [Apiospora hydei]|uniref:Uncharacterized protein n=1 Tax=Apiospora hydei TaxID=1337664 RepID=A0ABR1V5T4_9PEZI